MRQISSPQISKFLADHPIKVRSIHSQPFLGADIYFEKTKDSWEISLYPRVADSYIGNLLIVASLASIWRREHPWFKYPFPEEFQKAVAAHLSSIGRASDETFNNELWGFYSSFSFGFELRYALEGDYLSPADLRELVAYFSTHFVTVQVASQFLSAMAALRHSGGDVTFLYDELIRRKRYDMLRIVDAFQETHDRQSFSFADVQIVFDEFFPGLQRRDTVIQELSEVSAKVFGPRQESEISYDVAVSFAGEDRNLAREISDALLARGFKVFFDEYEQANLWGKDLFAHLSDVYGKMARFCLMIISRAYADKQWTNHERKAAQAKAFSHNEEYILPLRVDDTEIPGMLPTVGYLHMKDHTVDQVVHLLVRKLDSTQSG